MRLEQAMKNITSCDQEILLAMISLALARVQTEEISY